MYFHEEFINEPTEIYPSSHANSIIALPNGDLLAAWFSGSAEKNLDIADVYARKPAGADAWLPPEVFHKTPGRSEGNTCSIIDTNGTLWMFFNTMWFGGWTMTKIRYKTSTDNGYTWSEPKWFHKHMGWLIRNKPLILDNGEMLVPAYSEVISYKSFVMVSKDRQKWQKYGRVGGIKKPCMQPSIVQLSDKTLLMYLRTTQVLGKVYQSRSTDRGRHWTDPVPTEFPNPNAGIDLFRSTSGDLLFTHNESTTGRSPLCVVLSEDEGKTWPYKKILEDTPGGEFSYPYMIQDDDEVFHVGYTFNRRKIKHVEFDKDWVVNPT
ncbi:MAG TPA: sialidase family protein [Candidatus Lokiarchaeia archaeon]|nr:sialidase family protein [Candidatus Lokiarchaeia archaeon]